MYKYSGSRSDLNQESYVLTTLDSKEGGYYVELGSGDPVEGNNTLLLETKFGWTGLAIDSDRALVEKYNKERRNKCVEADALTFNYEKYFVENNFPEVIDYLQIDIDNHEKGYCLLALLALPMLKYKFKVITIEHDLIKNFKYESMRDAQREILHSLGYTLSGQFSSEDWWINRDYVYSNSDYPSYYMHPYFEGER